MSVKGKVKRLNREVERLHNYIEDLIHDTNVIKMQYEYDKAMLEKLIKFFVVNQVGKPEPGGVHIDEEHIDKLDSMNVDIWYEAENKAYVIKLKEE